MADERYIEAFNEKIHLPDWIATQPFPINTPLPDIDIINSGPTEPYAQIVRNAFLAIDRHTHSKELLDIDALESQVEDMEVSLRMVANRKLPQGTSVTVKQTADVGFTITLNGVTITGDNAFVGTVHAEEPSYLYYNEPTKKWVIAELSTDPARDNDLFTTIRDKTYTVVVFTLKKWS